MTSGADAVDELCRLALAAERLGCRVRLVDVGPDLRELLVAAGVDELLLESRPPDSGNGTTRTDLF